MIKDHPALGVRGVGDGGRRVACGVFLYPHTHAHAHTHTNASRVVEGLHCRVFLYPLG